MFTEAPIDVDVRVPSKVVVQVLGGGIGRHPHPGALRSFSDELPFLATKSFFFRLDTTLSFSATENRERLYSAAGKR